MSKDAKFFARPKVRFSQTDSVELEKEKLINTANPKTTVPSGKPVVRSIVTLQKPVTLLKPNRSCAIYESKDSKFVDKTRETTPSTVSNSMLPSTTAQAASLNSNRVVTESQRPLGDSSNTQNIKANSEKLDVPELSNELENDDAVPSSAPLVSQDKTLNEVLGSRHNVESNVSKKSCMKSKKGKENEATLIKKDNKGTNKVSSSTKATQYRTKPSPAAGSTKKSNVTCKASVTAASIRNLKSKSVSDMMPCHKYNKVVSRAKTSPVKKILVRDIIGPKVKPCIGPGVPRVKQDNTRIPKTSRGAHIKSCSSGENLARPEYNSIMCTINKLNEIKKQRVVIDGEHLPDTYQNLINRKISSALNFPLDEAIFKNLVDLSIDENDLPSRLTRSKDPEPRQKDIVPVLSNFFTPVSSDEYCTAVSTKPQAPEITDNWNAFKISDKIFEWKHSLDYV